MKDEYKELYTYCAINNGKNTVEKIESDEINEWKTKYIKRFNEGYTTSLNNLDVRNVYCDPDQTYQKGYNHHFFLSTSTIS